MMEYKTLDKKIDFSSMLSSIYCTKTEKNTREIPAIATISTGSCTHAASSIIMCEKCPESNVFSIVRVLAKHPAVSKVLTITRN